MVWFVLFIYLLGKVGIESDKAICTCGPRFLSRKGFSQPTDEGVEQPVRVPVWLRLSPWWDCGSVDHRTQCFHTAHFLTSFTLCTVLILILLLLFDWIYCICTVFIAPVINQSFVGSSIILADVSLWSILHNQPPSRTRALPSLHPKHLIKGGALYKSPVRYVR